jgi:hypothetical protein
LSSVSQNVLKFYQQLTGEERRIPFIFEDFLFCRSRVIGLDYTDRKTINSNNSVKFEVNWSRGSSVKSATCETDGQTDGQTVGHWNFAQLLELIVLRSVYFLVKFRFFIPEIFRMSRSKLRTPSPIHFKLRTVIGIDSLLISQKSKNYYQNVKILTKKNHPQKVDSLWGTEPPQTPASVKVQPMLRP